MSASQPARTVYHLTHANAEGKWHLKRVGGSPVGTYETKDEAKREGENLGHAHLKKGELAQLVIHRQDGSIEEEFTYGKDPREIPG